MGDIASPETFSNWRTWPTENRDTAHLWVNHVAGMKLRIKPMYEPFSDEVRAWKLQDRPWGPNVTRGTGWRNVDSPRCETEYKVARAAHGYARAYNNRKHPRGGEGYDPL